ncbi:MAG: SAM-dependent methyltransferase [Bacteroidales bacterium]|nr:SAM-dependent methyltransferase [Bacteroidales bacterium]
MPLSEKTNELMLSMQSSLTDNTFVKLSLGNYKGKEENLKNIYVKRIAIKGEEKLSFTYRYKTRDIVKNYPFEDGIQKIHDFLKQEFYVATVFTTAFDLSFENLHNKKFILRKNAPTILTVPSADHDRSKNRLISANEKPYLTELKITDETGKVLPNSQDKYKQINHYIEILSTLIKEIPAKETLKVVDMGSGKGYLTFALYDYLTNVLKVNSEVIGVEFRPELVDLCTKIAKTSGFSKLSFEPGTIENYDNSGANILIALHACDTATDDAIFKGITANADLIVVAPCCHKQIRRQMEAGKAANELDFLTKYGIFLERQAEMVTDGIRALILEYFGYKTKVFQFISDAHTPKNVMIVGIKSQGIHLKDEQILQKIKDSKTYFGIEYHHLEKMLGIL